VKLHLGERARSHVQGQEAWWAENRPAAPDLFAREFKETLEHIRTVPGAGVRWPTSQRPSLRRILMPRTLNHVYFRVDEEKGVVHVLAVWGAPRERTPKL
jgi:plasmid stabilization system protein ParE